MNPEQIEMSEAGLLIGGLSIFVMGVLFGLSLRNRWWVVFAHQLLCAIAGRRAPPDLNTQQLNTVPATTRWANLGLWNSDADDYISAAQRLADAHICKLNFRNDGTLLAIGVGEGEELQTYRLCQPDIKIIAYEPNRHSFERAKANYGNDQYIQLFNQPIESMESKSEFDWVVALDCAYHFRDIFNLYKNLYASQSEYGQLVFTTICLQKVKPNLIDRMLLKICSVAFGIPLSNLHYTSLVHEKNLKLTGYKVIQSELLTESVLEGFVRFVRSKRFRSRLFSRESQLVSKITAFLLNFLLKRRLVEYRIYYCQK